MELKTCHKCELCATRNNVVLGKGPKNAKIMIVGEAPGEDEDILGEPFVGRCGDLLTKLLTKAGLKREEIYITNTVKCRPTVGNKFKKNRPPTEEEINTCKYWLWQEIKEVKPRIIFTLGAVPTKLILKLKKSAKLGDYVGIEHVLDFGTIVPIWHPAFILRNGNIYVERCIDIFREHSKI